MASFDINEVARRTQFTSTGQTAFAFNFQVNATSEVQVFVNDTLKELSTHYSVALNSDGTGTVNFNSATTSGEVITIIGDQPLSRATAFQVGQVNNPTTLETEFDNLTIRQQQLKEMMDRSIQLKPSTRRTVTGTGTSGPLQFPYDDTASNNASKVIAYDSNGTSLELGPTTANLTTLAGISSDISTVAGISSNVTSVASNATNINTVAGISSNITTVAGISSNVTTVAGISSDVSTVASANSNISTVASGISNVNTVAGSISNVNTTAGSISNVNTVAGSISNVNTVASNVTGVNSFAERYRIGSSDPSSSLDAGDLFFNTTSNTLKFYDSSSWNVIASTFSIDAASDTNLTSPADGSLLLYDTSTSKFIDNVVSGDATLADTGALTIADNAITTAKINADAVTGAKIADDAIDSEHYTDGSIDTAHIADNQITNAKMADDSVGSAELIDNSVGAAALNISGNGSSGQMIVSDGDGSFSYADASGGTSAPTALSGTTPTIDWSANTQFTQTLSGATTYSYSNISAGASIELYLKNVGKSFDLLTQTHTAVSFSSQIGSSDTLYASFFNNDGSKFYIVEGVTTIFYEYNLSTNYDITSASFVQSKSGFPAITQSGFQFNADGTKLISIRGDDLHEHALTSAYDISTLNTTAANSVNLDTVLVDNGSNTTFPNTSNSAGLNIDNGRFNSDGTKLFISNERHGNNSTADQRFFQSFVIGLSSAYDITSTLTLLSQFDIGADLKVFGENYDSTLSSDISSDGKHMVVVQQNLDSNDERRIHQYFLETAFDLSTIKRVGTQLMADIQTGDPIGYIRIHPDGENMHLHSRRNGAFAGNQSLRLFDIQGDHKVTLPAVTSTVPLSFGDGSDPTTVSFLRLTSNDGTNVLITDHREIS